MLTKRPWRRGIALVLVPLTVAAAQGQPNPPAASMSVPDELRLPVGDGRWTDQGPRRGEIFVCSQYAEAMRAAQPRTASVTRPRWFSEDGRWYYPGLKPKVTGEVHHHGVLSADNDGLTRTVHTNSLPIEHATGVFPIQPGDPAYQADRNPNAIAAADLTIKLPEEPEAGPPRCVTNEVGVMLTGPVLLTALDAAGRDAGAWEVQDRCSGHPEAGGLYHYHTPSGCGTAQKPADEIVGWALDGYPITGSVVGPGRRLTNDDLDECHGQTGVVQTQAGRRRTYRYVLTAEYPHSVACFRGRAVAATDAPHHAAGGRVVHQ